MGMGLAASGVQLGAGGVDAGAPQVRPAASGTQLGGGGAGAAARAGGERAAARAGGPQRSRCSLEARRGRRTSGWRRACHSAAAAGRASPGQMRPQQGSRRSKFGGSKE